LNFVGKFDAKLPVDGPDAHSAMHAHVDGASTHAPSDAIIVPDAQLLFGGDFKRSGVDLVLSNDDHELVLHDYFKGEKRAALASPDGAHLTGDLINALAGHVEYAQADGGAAAAAAVVGHVTKLTGTATAIRNGVSIILNQGDNIDKGDVLQSGADTTLGVTFIDGTVFGLSSNARMVVNEMVYDPNGSNNSSLLSLVAGTISFVAGETAKHGDMKVDTPVATMGIRGTAVLVEIDFSVPGQNGAPSANFQVLMEPDGSTGSYILFDKNTLAPLATVNTSGTLTKISEGVVSFQVGTPLSPDQQKLIQDLFTTKFGDANTKSFDHFTDSLVPQSLTPVYLPGNVIATPIILLATAAPSSSSSGPTGSTSGLQHVPGAPLIATFDHNFGETPHITGSHTPDIVTAQINFLDPNIGDRPTVKVEFASFAYHDAHNNIITTLTSQEQAAIAAVEGISVQQDPGNNNNGSATWTYSFPDGAFDFLGAGETLTLTYTARVNNNFLQSPETGTKQFTIAITGTNDVPTIAATSDAITKQPGTGHIADDTASGTIVFTDVDLTDRPAVSATFSSFKLVDAHNHDVTSTLTAAQIAAVDAVEIPLLITEAAGNTNNGSATWTYSLADKAFDFLAPGDTLVLNYLAQVDDGHGGVATQPITITISDPAVGPMVLAEGVNTNSLGLPTEMLDSQAPGSVSNNGAGHGNFYSATLGAEFSGSGNAGIVNGSSAVSLAPFIGPLPGNTDTTNYLSIGAGGNETIRFNSEENAFGFYWGSLDPYNTIAFYNGSVLVASYSGADILPLFPPGNLASFSTNGYVEFSNLAPFNEVVLGTGNTNAFEVDNISAGYIPLAATQIASGASFAATDANQTTGIAFQGTGDTLTISAEALDSSLNFNPTISGLNASDAIDFQGTLTSAFYYSGVLTLLDGNIPAAYLHLAGAYSGDAFTVTSIGNNLSQIADPPAATATIASGGVLELNTPSSEKITFAGALGSLLLDHPASFHGQIAGISGTGDVLDLGGFDAAYTTTNAVFNPQNGTTILTVSDSQNHQSVALTSEGNYSTVAFNVTGDGHGGSDIVDSPVVNPVTITSAGSIEITGPAASVEDVTFLGSTGSLTLDNPSSFTGTVSGFTGDGTLAGSDHIDLIGIDYYSNSFTESYNATNDTVSVSDGTNSATLHFNGVYQAANFSFTSDGNGGTIVYDPPVAVGAGSAFGAKVPSVTANGHGFSFNLADNGHGPTGSDHPVGGNAHLFDGLIAANAEAGLNGKHVFNDAAGAFESHDAAVASATVKTLLHAADFHFV
jgi:VCBS repeat-containing protein